MLVLVINEQGIQKNLAVFGYQANLGYIKLHNYLVINYVHSPVIENKLLTSTGGATALEGCQLNTVCRAEISFLTYNHSLLTQLRVIAQRPRLV